MKLWKRSRSIWILSGALVVAFLLIATAAADYAVGVNVPNGSASGSVALSRSTTCWGPLHPYSWWHGLAYSVDTNTSAHTVYVNYVDYYGGDTSPRPPESSSSNFVWGPDSWEYGSDSSQSYRFGAGSAFNQHSFYSYDITLWLNRSFNYSPGSAVTTMAQFGASDGSGGVYSQCVDYSYLLLYPY